MVWPATKIWKISSTTNTYYTVPTTTNHTPLKWHTPFGREPRIKLIPPSIYSASILLLVICEDLGDITSRQTSVKYEHPWGYDSG